MPSSKRRETLLQHVQADRQSSRATVNVLRSLAALEDGPQTIGQRIRRTLWRELGYVGMEIRKLLLILVFNFAAVFMLFWLLSLL